MKKLFLIAILAFTACVTFAEQYSVQKAQQLKKNSVISFREYCYKAEVSNETNIEHFLQYFNYYRYQLRKYLTVDEINDLSKKFENKIEEKQFKLNKLYVFATFAHAEQVIPYVNQYTDSEKNLMLSILCCAYIEQKQFDKAFELIKQGVNSNAFVAFAKKSDVKYKSGLWIAGKNILLANGGLQNPKQANEIIVALFRYKTADITKEQQIEFLSELAEMYPIPGTDFNQWKPFMGFVGYKYKSLTGKQLF